MTYATTRTTRPALHAATPAANLLQRRCACGAHTPSGSTCTECGKQSSGLVVSNPNDAMEMEADRMADYVVSAAVGGHAPSTTPASAAMVQRQAADAELDDDDDAELEDDSRPDISADPELIGDESGRPKLTVQAAGHAGRERVAIPDAAGERLAGGVRSFMEGRFVHDFSAVRVHTDDAAARSARQLQAHAYTVGPNIYFNKGSYQPQTTSGKHLLAHELTHVVQQAGGAPLAVQRAPRGFKRPKREDAPIGKPKGRKRAAPEKPKCATGACDGKVASPVEKEIRNPGCNNEKCEPGPAADMSNFIRHLDVNLTTQQVTAEIGTRAKTLSTRVMLSSPNPSTTPRGTKKIGLKCGPCHTNMHAHGMGWFSGFQNGIEYGFHNSQRVAKGVHSLACVRTFADDAKWIHDNTASDITTVCVHTGDHCKPPAKAKPKLIPHTGSGGAIPAEAAKPPLVTDADAPDGDDDREQMVA